MSNPDWSKFTVRVPISAGSGAIYEAWTIPVKLEKWFLRKAKFLKPDGTDAAQQIEIEENYSYEWYWYGHGDNVFERGKILNTNGKDFVKFIFGNAGNVSVSIKTEEDSTIVELTQDNIPTDEKSKFNFHLGCSTGWTFYLANLKSFLEGGLDLRNKNVSVKNVINS